MTQTTADRPLLKDVSVRAGTLGEAWITSLRTVYELGHWTEDDGIGTEITAGGVQLRECINLTVEVDEADVNDPILAEHAAADRIDLMLRKYRSIPALPEYPISYGALIYENGGIDQIDWVIERIRKKRTTKSATICMHAPGIDELACLSMLDFKVREEKTIMNVVYRSQNVYSSQPGNILAMRAIQQDVADAVGAPPGPLFLFAASAHIYAPDLDAVGDVLAAFDGSA